MLVCEALHHSWSVDVGTARRIKPLRAGLRKEHFFCQVKAAMDNEDCRFVGDRHGKFYDQESRSESVHTAPSLPSFEDAISMGKKSILHSTL